MNLHLSKSFSPRFLFALFTGVAWGGSAGLAADANNSNIFARSLVSPGDPARLQRALLKARRGDSLTIGVIGGSITQGAAASQPARRYGNLVTAWWQKTFPQAKIDFVNAGIGATGSDYGALRAKRDVLSRHPACVIVEYAVNDPDNDISAETLEGLVRQILAAPEQPAVVLLFTMNQSGGNAQNAHGKVGRHYRLPMVSFRDALWPEITDGRMKWTDIEADAVHPNDAGHAYCARVLTNLFAGVLAGLPDSAALPPIPPTPVPLYSDLFEHVTLLEADALKPVANHGWTYEPTDRCWKTDQPGSTIEFEVQGRAVLIMDWHIRGPMGRAKVQVDDQPSAVREAWFDQTWGGYRLTTILARDLKPGSHRVKLELLPDKHEQSTGHEYRLLGLGTAGVAHD